MRTRTTADCGHRELAGTCQEGRWTQKRKQPGNIYIFRPGRSKARFNYYVIGSHAWSAGSSTLGDQSIRGLVPRTPGFRKMISARAYRENFSRLPQSRTLSSVPVIHAVEHGGGNGTDDLGSSSSSRGYRSQTYMTANHDPLISLLFACVTLLVPSSPVSR